MKSGQTNNRWRIRAGSLLALGLVTVSAVTAQQNAPTVLVSCAEQAALMTLFSATGRVDVLGQ